MIDGRAAMIDTHCHLNFPPLSGDVDGVLARATGRGVTQVVVPAYDHASWEPIVALAAAHPACRPALGLHPWLAHADPPGGDPAGFRALLAAALIEHRPVAVGEIGLDTRITTSGLDRQLPLLRAQLELAAEHDLPVILHCRGAFEELLAEIARFDGRLRGVLHAWSRGPELAERFLAAGLHLGLGGAVTRPRARRVRRAAAQAPLERLLLETDAPSIGLEGVLPEDAEPGHVADVAAAVAGLRGLAPDAVAEATTANAQALFGI
jgi:TatD DNase family protein